MTHHRQRERSKAKEQPYFRFKDVFPEASLRPDKRPAHDWLMMRNDDGQKLLTNKKSKCKNFWLQHNYPFLFWFYLKTILANLWKKCDVLNEWKTMLSIKLLISVVIVKQWLSFLRTQISLMLELHKFYCRTCKFCVELHIIKPKDLQHGLRSCAGSSSPQSLTQIGAHACSQPTPIGATKNFRGTIVTCLLYTSPSPRD